MKNSGGIVSVRTQVNNTQPALPEGYFYRTVNNKVQVVRKDASSLPKLSITAGGKLYKPGNKTVVTIPKSKAGNNSGKAQQILAGNKKVTSLPKTPLLLKAPKWETPEMQGKPIFSTLSQEGMILEQAIDAKIQIDKITGKVKPGGFFTYADTIKNEKFVREGLGVTHSMKKNVTHVAKFRFPGNIRIQNSTVGTQVDINGTILKGNKPQIEILNFKDRQKIELIDLREIDK